EGGGRGGGGLCGGGGAPGGGRRARRRARRTAVPRTSGPCPGWRTRSSCSGCRSRAADRSRHVLDDGAGRRGILERRAGLACSLEVGLVAVFRFSPLPAACADPLTAPPIILHSPA